VADALGLAQSTIGTWAARGFFDHYDYGRGGRGKPMAMSLRDALATALLVYKVRCGIEVKELASPVQFYHYADYWLRTLHQEKRVTRMIIDFEGIPGSNDSRFAVRMNPEMTAEPPYRGNVCLSITFELDQIFGDLISKLEAA
jgi:hypothetical protein